MTIHSPATTFDDVFEEYIQANTEDRPHDGRLHPSSLFFCNRRVIYDLRYTEREQTTGSKRPLLVGKVLHAEMQSALEMQVGKTIRQLFVEGRVDDPDTGIFGNFDALYQLMDGTWELWEGKTANANSFRLTKKSGEAKPDHALQGLSYIDVIRRKGFTYEPDGDEVDEDDFMCPNCLTPWKCNGPHELVDVVRSHDPIPDLTRLRVAYLDKDKHGVHEATYLWSQQWRDDELTPHLDKIERYRDGEALPPRLPVGSWQCASEQGMGKWCPYFDRCWNTDSEGVEI